MIINKKQIKEEIKTNLENMKKINSLEEYIKYDTSLCHLIDIYEILSSSVSLYRIPRNKNYELQEIGKFDYLSILLEEFKRNNEIHKEYSKRIIDIYSKIDLKNLSIPKTKLKKEDRIDIISILGRGKFKGLKVIEATKTSAEVIKLEAPKYGITAVEYINGLYEYYGDSYNLKIDNTKDQNIRYYGSNPNNYVIFNNELWRIIGVFGNNVKLIRKDSLGRFSWDSSESNVNGGWGVNEWSQSALKNYLNTMYYGGTSVTCYNGQNKKEVTCPANKLDNTSKSLIDNYTWNTGAIELGKASDTLAFYKDERGNLTGLINNDTVERTTTWPGYIGLPYATDWAYASGNDICEVNMRSKDSSNKYICLNDNWMSKGEEYWTLSPRASNVNGIWMVSNFVSVWSNSASSPYALHPSIYLKNNVQIISGTGTSSDPYILKAGV